MDSPTPPPVIVPTYAEGGARRPPRAASAFRLRLCGGLVALAGGAVLVTARGLPPNPSGLETHRALGLPPCGFLLYTRLLCPTCGMTTAFARMAHGDVFGAIRAQPAGAVLSILTLMGVVGGLMTLACGRVPNVRWEWLGTPPGLAVLAVVFFGSWGWKIVDVLMHRGATP